MHMNTIYGKEAVLAKQHNKPRLLGSVVGGHTVRSFKSQTAINYFCRIYIFCCWMIGNYMHIVIY
jgi:hypothetical protein